MPMPAKRRDRRVLVALAIFLGTATLAEAQTPPLDRGDAVITGFSGAKPAPSGSPLIDLDGASAQITSLQATAPPTAQLLDPQVKLKINARTVGQVFSIALDDGLKPVVSGVTPNVYLGATSAFGLRIVDEAGAAIRNGQAGAKWMPGQFGEGGGPGSLWKIDGTTGTTNLFATLPDNSGPGVGDIVYDTSSLHFYASDLDTGLIYRIDSAGNVRDSFDHGTKGRESAGLAPVEDDGKIADIEDPKFDIEDPKTWGLTPPERRVWGLGLSGGRLYYAVAAGPEIWSISLRLDGAFGDDARREFEISGTPGNHPVSDIAFDNQGLMYIAQRGGIRGSPDDSAFTQAKTSVVFRYRREIPDDPATPGTWVPVPDEFAIGYPPDHRNGSGGIALGYGYDDTGRLRAGACGAMLWSTGDSLGSDDTKAIHGLQGADRTLVRPDNEPPAKSYFVDFDGRFDDGTKTGQVGDVEIWAPCDKSSYGYGPQYAPLPYLPPAFVPPDYYPPGGGGIAWDFNLRIDKSAVPAACAPNGGNFLCSYVVRVTNTGPDPYIGPVTVHEKLPAAPAGATMSFNDPPWTCLSNTPTDYTCKQPLAVLWPGSSVDLKVTVDTPAPAPVCSLDNAAHLEWPWGFNDANPADDAAGATAGIPAAHCPPVSGEKSNLRITKFTWGQDICVDKVGHFECRFFISIANTGPGTFNGAIKLDEQIPNGTTVSSPTLNCSNGAPATCERAPFVLAKNQAVLDTVTVKVPKTLADDLGCKLPNTVKILDPAGGSDQNTDATDDEAQHEMIIPGTAQQCPNLQLSNLKIKKTEATGQYCPPVGGNWECKFKITVQNFGKPMNNLVRLLDALPPGSPAGTTAEFATPPGWSCNLAFFPLYVCQNPTPGLSHMEKAEITATVKIPIHETNQCSIKNTAQIVSPLAPAAQNTFGGDDKSDATAHFETIVPENGNPFCVHPPGPPPTSPAQAGTNLTITKTAGASSVTPAGQTTPFTITVTIAGPGVFSGPIVVRETLPGEPENATWNAPWTCEGQTSAGLPNDALCSHPAVELKAGASVTLNLDVEMPNSLIAPSGSSVMCSYTNHVAIEEAMGGSQYNTDASDDTASAQVTFAPFEKHGRQFCGADDLTTPPPPSTCPQGWSRTPVAGKCCPPRTNWNGERCSKDDPPDTCKPKTCARDQVWDVGVCRCVDLPDDGDPPIVTPPPVCKRKTCDSNEVWDVGVCRCVERQCPAGTTGRVPNCKEIVAPEPQCKRKTCGRGATWNEDSCACEAKNCPAGTIGTYPNCKPKACPHGFTGTPPNCKPKPKDCPSGTVGKFPNCRKIPTTCGPGFKGTPPNCKKIVEPPKHCPPGTRGKFPNCKPVVRPCPPGMIGSPPNCRKPQVQVPRGAGIRQPGGRPPPGTGPVRMAR